MLSVKMTDVELWAAWANMLLCSEAVGNALKTADVAGCVPLVSTLLVAMNLSHVELDEIALELGRRGLHMRVTAAERSRQPLRSTSKATHES